MTVHPLCPVPLLRTIAERLPAVFPEGMDHRPYLIREIAARTIFVMFYTGALEGSERWLRPNQVTRMTDAQSRDVGTETRMAWIEASLRPCKESIPGRWYADNTREPIRDETIRQGLCPIGAVVERSGLATTSSHPRYALTSDFADLFLCDDAEFSQRADTWREAHLSPAARARLALIHRSAVAAEESDRILVTFPNNETRIMSPGPSSVLSRAVIEQFAPRFLGTPGVVFLSESRSKVVARDDGLAKAIGLTILPGELLPDILLVDLAGADPLLLFVEVVVSDGPVDEKRKADLTSLAEEAGFRPSHLAFLTAFRSKTDAAFRKLSSDIAWGSFVWFASEPDAILYFRRDDGQTVLLSELLGDGC